MTTITQNEVLRKIKQAFARAKVHGQLHVVDITEDHGTEVALSADEPVVLASVFKLPVCLEMYRQAFPENSNSEPWLDITRQVTMQPRQRSPGPVGLSNCLDAVTMSLRDLAILNDVH